MPSRVSIDKSLADRAPLSVRSPHPTRLNSYLRTTDSRAPLHPNTRSLFPVKQRERSCQQCYPVFFTIWGRVSHANRLSADRMGKFAASSCRAFSIVMPSTGYILSNAMTFMNRNLSKLLAIKRFK